VELDPSNSRIQDLKHRIDLQLGIVAALIGEEGNELEAVRLLNALTNEMINALATGKQRECRRTAASIIQKTFRPWAGFSIKQWQLYLRLCVRLPTELRSPN
jgi:hypothetical protein